MGPVSQSYSNRRIPQQDMDKEFASQILPNLVAFRDKVSKPWISYADPIFELEMRKTKRIPQLDGNCFRFGDSPADEEFDIYVRLDRSNDAMKILYDHQHRGNKIDIYIKLKYHGEEFCKRWIPFESIPRLEMKFKVRCSRENVTGCLTNLSSQIQVFVAQVPENSKLVLESEEIFYVGLKHTMASLSICKVTDVSKDPKCVHHVNCLVFLDRSPCRSGSKQTADLCPECTKGSYLMSVFHNLKHLSGTIDLCNPEKMTTPMEIDSVDLNGLQDGVVDEGMEPADLSLKKTTTDVTSKTVGIEPAILRSILDPGTTPARIPVDKSSGNVGIQASVNETPSKADVTLNEMRTTKPIKRKHQGFPLEKFLTQKVERMRQRLLGLQKELTEKDQSQSSSPPELLTEAQVPSSGSIDLQSPRVTVVLLQTDGPPRTVPSILPKPVQNETSIPLTPEAERKDAEKPFKCPVEGCNFSFSCKSSVSRHKKRTHFPDKQHQCSHCDHVFPRPYMLQRHLDQRVCLKGSKHRRDERPNLGKQNLVNEPSLHGDKGVNTLAL